jgi:cell division protein FtsQ
MNYIQSTILFFSARKIQAAARCLAFLAFGITVSHGLSRGGYFENPVSPWSKLSGAMAGVVGLAADNIQISGLSQHDPQQLLAALNIRPGSSMIGFDANLARTTLQDMNWVKAASVQRDYPNTLKINVVERIAFALWQHKQELQLIDETGASMGHPQFLMANHLPIVTGEGANLNAFQLVNDLSAIPALSQKVSAAARVGQRRWTLYLDNGVKVALPELGVPQALKTVWDLEQQQGIFEKGISMIDMRIPGQMIVQLSEVEVVAGATDVKLSQKK